MHAKKNIIEDKKTTKISITSTLEESTNILGKKFEEKRRQTLDDIRNADLEEEFMQYLDEMFGADEVGDTELNDFIWFERDTIYDYLGLDENGEIPKDDEDDEEE